MPKTEIIVNGTFAQGSLGWTGTDLETSFAEGAYLGNGSANRVAEIDGNTGPVTVMQQSITVGSGLDTELTFRTALRTASLGNAATDGFRLEIFGPNGNVIVPQTILPGSTSWSDFRIAVTFPTAGTYTLRLTEVGRNDSLGAIVDDVSMLVCFTADSRIETDSGPRRAGALALGDLVWTLDGGLQPIRWIGRRRISLREMVTDPKLRPIRFAPGALGRGQPSRPMLVSPQHRVCVGNWKTELYFGASEALIPATALVNGTTVRQVMPDAGVTYVHFLLDGHHLVRSDGALTESFMPTLRSIGAVAAETRRELFALFPTLEDLCRSCPTTVRPVLKGHEARLLAQTAGA